MNATPSSPPPSSSTPRISRDDIEAKFREVQGEVDDVAGEAVNYALVVGIGIAVGVVVVAYWIGKRRGRRRGTVIEVKRL